MRKIFFLCLFFTCAIAYGQDIPANYIWYKFTYGTRIDRGWFDKSIHVPRDTIYTKSGLAIKGSTLYYGDSTRWYAAGSGGGSVVARRDSLISGSTTILVNPKFYGQINNDSTWSNLSGFNNRGGTWSVSGGKIRGAGFSGIYTETLDFITNLKTSNGYANLKKWRIVAKVKVLNASGNGFGFGVRSYTTNSLNDILARYNSSSGNTYINAAGGAQLAVSSSTVTTSNNDYVYITFERDAYTLTATVRNSTTNSATVTTTYTLNPATPDPLPNTGRFAIWGFGSGTPEFQIDSIGISSKELMNADLAILGDSKTDGFQVAADASFANKLGQKYSTVIRAGGYETTAEWILALEEFLLLNPKQVLLTNPSNDARTSVNVDSTKNRYYRIERSLRDLGIAVYHLNGFYETGSTPNAWVAHIAATRSADSTINTMDPTRAAGSNTGDNVHLTVQGNLEIYDAIMDANKLFWLNEASGGSSLSSGDFIQNSPSSQQTARFNITHTSRNTLQGYLDLGTQTAVTGLSDVPLRIKTGTNMNLWFYSDNTNNYIYSSDNSNSTFKQLRLGSSSFDVYTGSGASVQAITATSAGDVTIPQHTTLGSSGLGSTIAVTIVPHTNNAFNFYDASNDEQYFSSTQSGNGGGRTMHIQGLDLRFETRTAGSTVTEVMRINTGNNVNLPLLTANTLPYLDGSKNLTSLSSGNSGERLESTGSGSSPTWRRAVRNISSQYVDVGNVGAGEDDLMTYSIPAGLLASDGDYIEFEMQVQYFTGAGSPTKQVKLYFGSQLLMSNTSGTSVGYFTFKGTVIRTSATTQRVNVEMITSSATYQFNTQYSTAAETLSGAVILKATGTATNNDDIVQHFMTVKFVPVN